MSWKKRSMSAALPASWLKKTKRAQCMSQDRCVIWLSGVAKFLLSIASRSRVIPSQAWSQRCIRMSQASLPQSAEKFLSRDMVRLRKFCRCSTASL